MTPDQEEHLKQLKEHTLILMDLKYRQGQVEHGGNLFDHTAIELVDAAIDEAIDELVYLQTLRDKLLEDGFQY